MDQTPIGEVDCLPSSCSFLKIIADHQDTSNPKEAKCQNCDTGSATFWCEGCSGGTYYCGDCCAVIHSAKAMSGHNRLTLQEKLRTIPSFQMCATHNEEAKFYCADCADFFCSVCIVDDHKLHTTYSIFKHADNIRTELKDCLNPIKDNQSILETQHLNLHEEICKTKDQILLLEEELQKWKNQLAIQEFKEQDVKDRQESVKLAYLFLSKSIQDVAIMDLVKTDHLGLMKKQIEAIFLELYPDLNTDKVSRTHEDRREQSRAKRKSQNRDSLNQCSRESLKVSVEKPREKRRSQKRQSSSGPLPNSKTIPLTWNPFASSSSIVVSNDGKVAKKTSTCSYSSVVALQGWDTGVHRWVVWGTYTSCFDTVGVVTEDQNPDAPLRYGLGVYPGDHRKDTKIAFTEKVVPANTVYRCTLDMEKHVLNIEFKLPENEHPTVYTIDVSKAKGKLYPAVILCNSTSYTIENWDV